jgi:hypothetical protein
MILTDGALGLVLLGLWIFCVIDVITTDALIVRNLPKMAWLFIVLLLPDLGSIAWLVAGHPWQENGRPRSSGRTAARYPEYDRPGRAVPASPDDDEEFLRQIRERAEQQRRQYQERRRAELEAERDDLLKRPEEQ